MDQFLKYTLYRGRVTEVWTDAGQTFAELLLGADRFVVNLTAVKSQSEIVKGSLVAAVLTAKGEVSTLEVVSSMPGWSPVLPNGQASDSVYWTKQRGQEPALQTVMGNLIQRQKVMIAIRHHFHEYGFLEVETPLLVKSTCPDVSIDSIEVGDHYLVTSTEYQIKRMIVGGFDNVFTLTKNFRGNDQGQFHSIEFTMLEWARAYGDMDEIEEDATRIVRRAFQTLYPGQSVLEYQGHRIEMSKKHWRRMTVREVLRTHFALDDLGDFSLGALKASLQAAQAKGHGVSVPENLMTDPHLIVSFLMDQAQSKLGIDEPVFVRDWPAFMTSSAQVSKKDPHVCDRSELYIGGVEISDGFPFLRDPKAQRDSFERECQIRKSLGKPSVKLDERYIKALEEGIPPGAGMALGVDRLVMVLVNAPNIASVQAFAWEML